MLEYNLYPIYILLLLRNFIYINSYYYYYHCYLLLLSSSNDASVDIVDNEGSFEFSHKAEFASTLP